MKISTWTTALILALLLGIGCTAPSDPLMNGQGALRFSIESADPALAGYTGHIRVFEAGGDDELAARAFDPSRGARHLELIYLEAGSYDLEVTLEDEEAGLVAMSGRSDDVRVIDGQLTSLTIRLAFHGGIQVVVEVAAEGDAFEIDERAETDHRPGWLDFAGAQRVEGEAVQYYGLASRSAGRWTHFYLLSAASPGGLLGATSATQVRPFPSASGCRSLGLVTLGDHLYGLCFSNENEVVISRSRDGEDWRELAVVLAERRSVVGGEIDQIQRCALWADTQLSLVCLVKEVDEAGPHGDASRRLGLVYAFSSDGEVWSDLIPYDGDGDDAPVVFEGVFGEFHADALELAWTSGFDARMANGVAVAWVALTRRDDDANRTYVTQHVSHDRRAWSGPNPIVFDGAATVFGAPLEGRLAGLAVYQTPLGPAMVLNLDSQLRLALPPADEGGE